MVLGLKRKMDLWELAQEKWRSDLEQTITSSVVKRLEGGILEKCIEKLRDQVLGLLVNESSKANGLQASSSVTESRGNAEAAPDGSGSTNLEPLTSSPGRARSSSSTRSPSAQRVLTTLSPSSLMNSVKRMASQDIMPHSSLTIPISAQNQTPRAPQMLPVSVISPPISNSPTRQVSSPVAAIPTALQASPCVATRQFSGAPLLYSFSADATGPPAVQIADGQSLGARTQIKVLSAADLQDVNGPAVRSCSTIRSNMSSLRKEMAEQRTGLLQSPGASVVTGGAASVPVPHQTPRTVLAFKQQRQQPQQPQTTPQMMQREVSQTPPAPRRAPAADSQYVPAMRQAQGVHAPISPWSASRSQT